MSVFILVGEYDYESSDILYVALKKETLLTLIEKDKQTRRFHDRPFDYDSVHIEEHIISE